ncbi:MAG: DUF2088 domain-containing protein [Bacteroidales bacterium]|nr:DUF2088 domain-containing protein [Bacteroidales bacterium]
MTAIPYKDRQIMYYRIRQEFQSKKLGDIRGNLQKEMSSFSTIIEKDKEIAIGVGSRGINNIQLIVTEIVKFVKDCGGNPFIFPAMGSHGGATAEGQEQILEELGITADNTGAPVRSSMEVVNLSDDPSLPAYMDKNGYLSDGIILVNRIAPHTDFNGDFESGLVKMTVIGLGKAPQAEFIHGKGLDGLEKIMPEIAKKILASGKIIAGAGIVEDAYKDTMEIKVLPAKQFMEKEKDLLEMALQNCPRLPLEEIDVLIVDQIGKDISGIGMDPYVIGRMRLPGMPEPDYPKIRSIIACSLTKESHGNGLGIGLADVITQRLFDQLDMSMIYRNVYTSTFLERAKIPVIGEHEQKCLEYGLRNCGEVLPGREVIMRIKNTRHLDELYVSGPALEKLRDKKDIEVISGPIDMINADGSILPF